MASETAGLPNTQSDLSASGNPTLASIAERVERTLAAGDYELTAQLMERNYVAVLFGMLPSRFGEILDTLERNGAPEGGFVRTMNRLLFGERGGDRGDDCVVGGSDAADALEQPRLKVTPRGFPVDSAMRVGRMFRLRMAGRPVEAMRLAATLDDHFGLLDQAFGRHHGWGLYVKVQLGITAMLAGDFSASLVHFTQARMLFALPPYQFLARDACVKAAVIEALYGDEERARSLLDEADRIPHSGSWLELELDAAHTIASSRVRAESPEEALQMLERLPLSNLGELWPFYVNALQRAFAAVGNLDESVHRLATFDQMSLLSVRGEGFLGSALPLATAMNAMILGDLSDARRRLESADASIVAVKVLFAVLELAAARPQEALKRIAGLRDETRGLRFLEIWRLAVAAGSYYALGSHEECAEVLGFAVRMPGGVRPREARFFTGEVGAFARTRYQAWPSEEETAASGPLLFSVRSEVLTDRELEVLRELRLGLTREQIAKAQYISINTLKAHLRSVYRKLGVNSRAGAVLEAERRGLI